MAKAILVLDEMPKRCFDCKLRLSHIETFCIPTGKTISELWEYTDQKESIPDWCPLKELPKHKLMLDDFSYENGTAVGWDECLDAIAGTEIEMERLTKRSEFYPEIAWPNDRTMFNHRNCLRFAEENCETLCDMGCPIGKCFSKLADYEDAEEQGRLIEFPVAIGQHLWAVDDYGCFSELTVRELIQTSYGQQILAESLGIVTYYSLSRIGETIFPTREQAEAKLKEMEAEDEKEST